jgi:hypothetical protein
VTTVLPGGTGAKAGGITVNGRTFSMHSFAVASRIVNTHHTVVIRIQDTAAATMPRS